MWIRGWRLYLTQEQLVNMSHYNPWPIYHSSQLSWTTNVEFFWLWEKNVLSSNSSFYPLKEALGPQCTSKIHTWPTIWVRGAELERCELLKVFLHSSHNYCTSDIICLYNLVQHHEFFKGETVQNCVPSSPFVIALRLQGHAKDTELLWRDQGDSGMQRGEAMMAGFSLALWVRLFRTSMNTF